MTIKVAEAPSVPSTRFSGTRRTRIVCISDTHNCTVKLPKGDVLIHAGDLTNQGSYSELSKAIQWLEKAPFECKIVIAGNHDLTLDHRFYALHSTTFHNQIPQDPARCLSLLTSSPSITYLSHTAATVRLASPSGPGTTFTVFGSPYSPEQDNHHHAGPWAFQYGRDSREAEELWAGVPLETDILVTHTPARGHCDDGGVGGGRAAAAAGCEVLRRAMWRVRPRLHVCGHMHEGRGAETVRWDLDGGRGNVRYKELGIERWRDEEGGGGKMSLVDLTGRRARRLDNDGGPHPCKEEVAEGGGLDMERCVVTETGEKNKGENVEGLEELQGDRCYGLYLPKSPGGPEVAESQSLPTVDPLAASPGGGTIGLGLSADMGRSPARSDMAALKGRMGRRETCVVNCAITATKWPHTGGRLFNKPIVVDLNLPVWTSESE